MARSLNRVELIGNLTRDPELRYTPQGTAVCTFGLATNRTWVVESGEKKEDVEFHRIVAWNKLAELCSQLLTKGRKIYIEGRISTRNWTGQDGAQRTTTEIVINDMIILDSRRDVAGEDISSDFSADEEDHNSPPEPEKEKKAGVKRTKKGGEGDSEKANEANEVNEVNPDDIPF